MNGDPLTKNERRWAQARLLLAAVLLAVVALACSVGQTITGRAPGPAPTATKTPRPTFTPLAGMLTPVTGGGAAVRGTLPPGVTVEAPAQVAVAQVVEGTPGASVVGSTHLVIYATDTPRVTPTVPATASPTPRAATNTPRPAVTPLAVIQAATLNGRRGPGTNYESIGQAKKGTELLILGKSPDGAWFQVCCMANQPVWVSAEQVTVREAEGVPVMTPPPTPFPTVAAPRQAFSPLPQPTAIATRGHPFDIAKGPEFPMKRDNGILTIWVKVYEGPTDNQRPLGGYVLKVKRNGVDISNNIESFGDRAFDKTGPHEGAYTYNLKFEINDAGEADWEIFLARPGGFQVSPVTKFTTMGDSYRNLVVYIAYFLAR